MITSEIRIDILSIRIFFFEFSKKSITQIVVVVERGKNVRIKKLLSRRK